MKNIILIALFCFSIYSQSGWFWQNPLPQGNHLRGVDFINSTTGYAVGEGGTVIKTTNAGLNWLNVSMTFPVYLESIDFLNVDIGYAATAFATIVKTTNGGHDWTTSLNVPNSSMHSIFVLDENNIYATGAAAFYKTTNGGINWFSFSTGYYSTGLYDVNFLNVNTGFIVGFPDVVLKTTNGGDNWVNTVSFTGIQQSYQSIKVVNNNIFITNRGQILKSTNLGTNWNCVVCSSSSSLSEITFNNAGTGLVLGTYLHRSSDYGESWSPMLPLNFSLYYPTSISLNGNNSIIVGEYGMILRSSNAGVNWTEISDRTNLNLMFDIFYTDANTGFISASGGKIYKTTNSGNSWILKNSDTAIVSFSRVIFNGNLGLTGNNGRIYRTTNLGENWQLFNSGNESIIYRDFDFIDQSVIYISGSNNLKSTNGGLNWSNINGPNGTRTGLDFINENEGYNICDGLIYKTTNGGNNWTGPANVSGFYRAISFFDENNGIAVGNSGYIARTTNAGNNWSSESINTDVTFTRFSKVNANLGFVLSAFQIYKTTDKGFSWLPIIHPNVDGGLFGIYFMNQNTGTVTGYWGKILKTTTGGEPIGIEPISNEIPKSYNLFQNYPNPFNPVTKIKFNIPEADNVSLKIYDILGSEISTIVNENLKPGVYEVNWNAATFASGVYFYTLANGDFIETRKMVLIK